MFGGKLNPSLLDLKHLNYFDLSFNNFSASPIPSFLDSMKSLTSLNLSNARLWDSYLINLEISPICSISISNVIELMIYM